MSQDLVVITDIKAIELFGTGAVDDVLARLKADVMAVDRDISTKAGREQIASLAHKVARSKTYLDGLGKDLVAELKEQTGKIDKERKRIRDELDALRDEVRKPLTDWEEAERARVAKHEAGVRAFEMAAVLDCPLGTSALAERRAEVESWPTDGFQEFAARAEKAKAAALAKLDGLLTASRKADADHEELERLRREDAERKAREDAEAAERAREEREARIAKEAREEAEREAHERAEMARIESDRERQRIEAERIAAERRVEQAERKAEADRIAAQERLAREKAAAIEAERRRVEDEKRREAESARKREANRAHRAKINNAAAAELVRAGLSDADAKTAVAAIASGKIPSITISY